MLHKTLNIKGTLTSLEIPLVMGILNITPDSFYADSRKQTEAAIEERIQAILSEGGQIIDLGGYSSRPDASEVSPEEEMKRLAFALKILNTHYPDVTLSVDTFRADVARRCVEEYGVAIINDISGGELDAGMFETVARLHVPYIMMHMRGTPRTMQQHTDYADMMEEIMLYFARKVRQLRLLGVNDIILDPGFGFSKTVDQNYMLMGHLSWYVLPGCIPIFYHHILLQHHPVPAAEMPVMSLLQHQNLDLSNQVPSLTPHTIHTSMHLLSHQVYCLPFFSPPFSLVTNLHLIGNLCIASLNASRAVASSTPAISNIIFPSLTTATHSLTLPFPVP